MIGLAERDWLDYLVRNRKRLEELIYIRPGQRIIAVRPPYRLPWRRGRGLIVRTSIAEFLVSVANSQAGS